jgi:hypothetical protein
VNEVMGKSMEPRPGETILGLGLSGLSETSCAHHDNRDFDGGEDAGTRLMASFPKLLPASDEEGAAGKAQPGTAGTAVVIGGPGAAQAGTATSFAASNDTFREDRFREDNGLPAAACWTSGLCWTIDPWL